MPRPLTSRIRDAIAPPLPPEPEPPGANPESLRRAVRQLEILARRRLRDGLAGEFRSAFRGSGIEIAELRPYAPGDDARDIDWKATARRAAPVARRYVEERARTVLLLIDSSASTGFGRTGRSVASYALEIAGPIALAASASGDRVGLAAFSDGARAIVPPAGGRKHALRLLRDCLQLEPAGGTDLAAAFGTAGRLLRRRSIVFAFSDFLGAAAGWPAALSRLASRHDVIAVGIRDPRAGEVPISGLSRWGGLESGAEAMLAGPMAAPAEEPPLEARLRACGAEPLILEVGDDWLPPLTAIMRRRR